MEIVRLPFFTCQDFDSALVSSPIQNEMSYYFGESDFFNYRYRRFNSPQIANQTIFGYSPPNLLYLSAYALFTILTHI